MFSNNGDYKYIEKLSVLVNEYNNSVNRTISMKPKDVTKKHEAELLEKVYHRGYSK